MAAHPEQQAPSMSLVALIAETDNGLIARPAFERGDPVTFSGQARAGDLVELQISDHPATIITRFGRPSSVEAVIAALAAHAGERAHDATLEAAAQAVIAEGQSFKRRDLTQLATFTIDGPETRDFDDAISARREGQRIRVWVHVADVAAFVRPDSLLDLDAKRRATSVYLPTRVVPMLPKSLSTGVCSLTPGDIRSAISAEFLLDHGRVVEQSFYRSRICSKARLTYDHVDDVFLGRAEPGPTYKAALAAARAAAIDRTRERQDHGRQAEFIIDKGQVTDLSWRQASEAHQLIERLMVLTNEAVARFLTQRNTPAIYRTHTASPERQAMAAARLRSLGLAVTSNSIADLYTAVTDQEALVGPQPALQDLLRSVRPPARYAREPSEHTGLGLQDYTHFTSPIRRYADLLVHRALLVELGCEPLETAPRYAQLAEIAEHLSQRTLEAKRLERRAEAICRVSLLRWRLRSSKLERTLPGTVIGIGPAGCFLTIDCAEGLLPARALGGQANEERTIWRAERRALQLGDQLTVRIAVLDPVRGQVRLMLA
jgi:ribonuclease R